MMSFIFIVIVYVPNAPDGLFGRIEKESEDMCICKETFLDYTCGIGKMYNAALGGNVGLDYKYCFFRNQMNDFNCTLWNVYCPQDWSGLIVK
jgi:hypothetical protein